MNAIARRILVVGAGALIGTAGAVALFRALPPTPEVTGGLGPPLAGSGAAEHDAGNASNAGDAIDAGDASNASLDAEGGPSDAAEPEPKTLEEQRERLYAKLASEAGLSPEEIARVRAIFEASPYLGQGNPEVSVHPMTRAECLEKRSRAAFVPAEPGLCGRWNMVPAFNPGAGESKDSAKVCVDQYEFPDLPCEYPVVNVRANEAADICRAVGKRLCDAHEWEGACAGAIEPPETEYLLGKERQYSSGMHNLKRPLVWAYGPKKNHALCATNSSKSKSCPGGGWKQCGSNTYPAGAFPECKSSFGVYDQHGNAAEHMNLPTRPEEMMSRGPGGGLTEMKGSWFIFSKGEPHLDDCRWREPSWHESKVSDVNSHRNYHLGFRCCKDR